jgi:hypothetical protein
LNVERWTLDVGRWTLDVERFLRGHHHTNNADGSITGPYLN